jgi:single-strand DNA-binding protein
MNKVILLGRLTRDPDTRQGDETTVTRFKIAVDRRFRKAGDETSPSADFPSCVAFGKTAEFISKYFKQGMKIAIEGRIQTGDYTDKDGVKHYTTEVVAEAAEFAESKKVNDTPPPSGNEWVNVPNGITNDLPFK